MWQDKPKIRTQIFLKSVIHFGLQVDAADTIAATLFSTRKFYMLLYNYNIIHIIVDHDDDMDCGQQFEFNWPKYLFTRRIQLKNDLK